MGQERSRRRRGGLRGLAAGAALLAAAGTAAAQGTGAATDGGMVPGLNSFGLPGLIDTPIATPLPDGTVGLTHTVFPGTFRTTLSFQIGPRLSGSFRYSGIDRPRLRDRLFDRSFDLNVLLLRAQGRWPDVTLGLRDFIGTGEYSSEFIVATGQVTPRLRVTAGLAWGRLASGEGFANPLRVLDDRFRTRPDSFTGRGGRLEAGRFFRGDAAPILGVEWQASERVRLLAEYSADAYRNEAFDGDRFDRRIPVNLGVRYMVGERTSVTGFVLHGGTVGLVASIALHPNRPLTPLQLRAPAAVEPRAPAPAGAAPGRWSQDWASDAGTTSRLRSTLAGDMAAEGLELVALDLTPTRATVRFTDHRHGAAARTVGRTARLMTALLPPSVEEFVLVPTVQGMAVTAVTLRRSDIEALEHAPDGTEALLARTTLRDGAGAGIPTGLWVPHPPDTPRLGWSVLPYLAPTIMDPAAPVRLEAGLRASARVALASNVLVSGSVTQRVAGNLAGTAAALEACRADGFCYERVRSEAPSYVSDSPVLERLTAEHFSRPVPQLYGRLTAGWLERMYAGVSAELLWQPDGPLALGVEVNRVRRRAPTSFGGLTDYAVTTGHVSAYYDFGGGYMGQLDVGQYLAGDRGATLTFSREFASGWRLGAYATLTDMPFSAFGEGSFDKGITLSIPIAWFDGRPSRARNVQTLRSLQRDGGARLDVANRLQPMVRELDRRAVNDSWDTVWQ